MHMYVHNYTCEYTLLIILTMCLALLRVIEGAVHNLPDIHSHHAAKEILGVCEKACQGEIVIALVSGGGSALLPYPVEGVTLEEKCRVRICTCIIHVKLNHL